MKKVFKVPQMHCSSCIILLEGIEDELPGIISAQADARKKQMIVDYDEMKLSTQQIIDKIKDISAYEVTPDEH